jgi:MoxR-like ATPase
LRHADAFPLSPAGRNHVVAEDVADLAADVLRHRIVLTFEAEAEDMDSDTVVTKVLGALRVP